MKNIVPLLALCILGMTGCDNADHYQITKDAGGRTLRLDKRTGDVAIISGNKIEKLKGEQEQAALEQMKSWPKIGLLPLDKTAIATLQTSFRNGKLYYQFTIIPATKKLMAARHKQYPPASFIADLLDPNGFKMASISIPVSSLMMEQNEKGATMALTANSYVIADIDDYSKAAIWTISWSGFNGY